MNHRITAAPGKDLDKDFAASFRCDAQTPEERRFLTNLYNCMTKGSDTFRRLFSQLVAIEVQMQGYRAAQEAKRALRLKKAAKRTKAAKVKKSAKRSARKAGGK